MNYYMVRHIVQKKPGSRDYILYDPTYTKFKNREKKLTYVITRIMVLVR